MTFNRQTLLNKTNNNIWFRSLCEHAIVYIDMLILDSGSVAYVMLPAQIIWVI